MSTVDDGRLGSGFCQAALSRRGLTLGCGGDRRARQPTAPFQKGVIESRRACEDLRHGSRPN